MSDKDDQEFESKTDAASSQESVADTPRQDDSNDEDSQTGEKKKKDRKKTITENDTYKCELCTYKTGYKGFFERHLSRHYERDIK
jgi:hypothetical protein